MNELFLKTINMSISASWLILAVLILRFALKKAPRWINILLWGIVAIRLIFPFSIESALSLIPSAETISPDIMMEKVPSVRTGIPPVNNIINPIILSLAPAPGASINPLQIWIPVLCIIWLVGIAALLLYTAVSCRRLCRKVSEAVILRDNIYQCENVSSPFVLGIIRPKIFLPYHMDEQDLNHVIAHEQAHIRRRDHWWKPLGFLLLTIHWFNPLIWLSYVLLCRDIELACDEKVIKDLGSEQRADYTQALVTCSVNRRMISACPLAFGEVSVKERVKSVMNYKKPAFRIIVPAVIVCVAVAVCFLTNPVTKRDSLKWAQKLSVDDVASADLVVFPQTDGKQFKNLSPEELATMVELINHCKGVYQSKHEELSGGSILFYVSMKDNTVHEVGNIGNTYLYIDGDYYKADYDFLNDWGRNFGKGNSPLPNGYFSDTTVTKWFDYLDNPSGMDAELTTELPEYPGITFRYTNNQITASKPFFYSELNSQTALISGMPIWNAYFCDLTGDGLPELCATYVTGSGFISSHVIIYDYANGVSYTYGARGYYDYVLQLNDSNDQLYVTQRIDSDGNLICLKKLVFEDNCIQLKEAQYYLTINAEGITDVAISLNQSSSGCRNADGSPFEKGERIWLESLDGVSDLRDLEISTLNASGDILWSASIPDGDDFTVSVQKD